MPFRGFSDGSMRLRNGELIAFALLVAVRILTPPLVFTGDEPRYAVAGLGLYAGSLEASPQQAWTAFLAREHIPASDYPFGTVTKLHPPSLGPGLIFGPALVIRGLGAARWVDFAIGCLGLFALRAILRMALARGRRFGATLTLCTLVTVAFSIPFAPYLDLMYPEMLLFATIAWGLLALARKRLVGAAFLAGLLPLWHVRALPLSIVFALVIALEAIRLGRDRRRLFGVAAAYCGPLVAWGTTQYHSYGSFSGGAFPTYAPAFATFWMRVGMQLYDVRHGLFAYSPIYLFAFAGLIAGAIAKNRLCCQCNALAAAYFLTFMWSSASESWTARFWVAALPFLAVGLAYWFGRVRSWKGYLPAAPLLFLTLANAIYFFRRPMEFLANRTTSVTYAAFAKASRIDLGAFLPVDSASGSAATHAETIPALLAVTALVLAALVVLALREPSDEESGFATP
jgi:hypothetical protein